MFVNFIGLSIIILKFFNNFFTNFISLPASDKTTYSAAVDDFVTLFRFLDSSKLRFRKILW